ncbi:MULTISPECIES: NAD(P)/FAD-dependent oxidoreductase [unclassified Xanthobacter]|uniref:NAD(P)/FAD-dependent oxidoreductase n=1 Tax=unclassified Xanthobacter TaxID=2623496 RepID=UPI001F3D3D35|nr:MULTISPECIES: NAD(P)/FAD-dependent oxidoreductase [unclassified Xanthobacter]
MDRVDCIVVGAGVVGLAVARALAQAGHDVIVLEAEGAIGTVTSARNSEVIHAGIYYAPGSLKARLCVAGRRALYGYCADHGVGVSRIGKLIVAGSADEVGYLEKLKATGEANGVEELRLLDAAEVKALEPALSVHAALFSPVTGIVDSHGLMLALQGDLEAAGGMVALAAPFVRAEVGNDGFVVEAGGEAPLTLGCRVLVNCAGLDATTVAGRIEGLEARFVPRPKYAKGNYFTCARKVPFRHLIYPVPEPGGLGTHLTLDLGGQGRFGPDVEWVETRDYAVDPARRAPFLASIRRYWPDVTEDDLIPGYSGIRPKLDWPDGATPDFVLQGEQVHGVPGLVNLFGIESPGLTSALALGDEVEKMLAGTAPR